MSWYCEVAKGHPIHEPYHDNEYGFPLNDERALFELQSLELFQAGLSWEIVLKKRPTTVSAFDNFDVDTVAAYKARDVKRLLNDAGIIRNRLKVDATIENAKRLVEIRESHGSFKKWLDAHHPLPKDEWVKLFKRTFRFTGGEITGEFLMSTGYLPGTHAESCPIYAKIAKKKPAWMRK